eukprot:2374407-Karenia_brevis.AAC.1
MAKFSQPQIRTLQQTRHDEGSDTIVRSSSYFYALVWQWVMDNDCRFGRAFKDNTAENVAADVGR